MTGVKWNYLCYIARLETIQLRGPLNKFPDLFRLGTFIDSAHMKL